VRKAAELIRRHLAGEVVNLSSIPVDLEGLAPFHRRVYEALHRTRPGQTLKYGELALLAGSPGAARAVAQAMKRNPIPILVPCHRVVASNGPGGFSMLGGMAAKERLLALEGVGHTGSDGTSASR
jgi:methylated-DNA-[protein]-cysteine S-methyltransferase